MKNKHYGILLSSVIALYSNTAVAGQNIDVVTTISVGPINMQLDIVETFSSNTETFNGDYREISINPNVPGAEIGVTVLDGSLYYGFSMLVTGQSVANYRYTDFDLSAPSDKFTRYSSQEITSRSSYNFYVGYAVWDQVSLYGGATFASGSYGAQVNIDELGPFGGARYSYQFGATTSLNFDLSYSLIATDTSLSNSNYGAGQHTISASNSAYSYSATWLKALDRGRSFFVRLKIKDLVLTGNTTVIAAGGGPNFGTATISGNQVLTILSLGMGF